VVACDLEAQQWGVAVASKFLAAGAIVPWARGGDGAIATQATANVHYGPRGLELLAGEKDYGVHRRFIMAADFGFSKTAAESLEKWKDGGKPGYIPLRDMVRVIRTFRPDVIAQRAADVIVTDGFTGNIALKLREGVSQTMLRAIREAAMSSARAKLGGALLRGALRGFREEIDPEAHGELPELALGIEWLRRTLREPQQHLAQRMRELEVSREQVEVSARQLEDAYQQEALRLQELASLVQSTTAIAAQLSIEPLVQSVVREAIAAFRAQAGWILLRPDDPQHHAFEVRSGSEHEDSEPTTFDAEELGLGDRSDVGRKRGIARVRPEVVQHGERLRASGRLQGRRRRQSQYPDHEALDSHRVYLLPGAFSAHPYRRWLRPVYPVKS